jgi:hypothetical protein
MRVDKAARGLFSLIATFLMMAFVAGCGHQQGSQAQGDHSQNQQPQFCRSLAHSSIEQGVNRALIDLASPQTQAKGSSAMHSAADKLRSIGREAPASLRPAFANAVSALDSLAASGLVNSAAATKFSTSLKTLGNEVESECHFPLG